MTHELIENDDGKSLPRKQNPSFLSRSFHLPGQSPSPPTSPSIRWGSRSSHDVSSRRLEGQSKRSSLTAVEVKDGSGNSSIEVTIIDNDAVANEPEIFDDETDDPPVHRYVIKRIVKQDRNVPMQTFLISSLDPNPVYGDLTIREMLHKINQDVNNIDFISSDVRPRFSKSQLARFA